VVALLAVCLQIIAIYLPTSTGALRRVLFVSSYLLLLAFAAANWRRPGIVILAIGLVLNFAVIVANGGLMPVTAEPFHRIHEERQIEGVEEGEAIPHSKNILLAKEDIRLRFLSDRLVRTWGPPAGRIISIGDIFILAGLVVTLGELFLPRFQRVPAGQAAREQT
jgi:hypothetical protein